MMEEYNNNIKKRIMFNKDSDYYFIAYNTILILDNLNCYEGKSNFIDYRKLIYILPLISNEYLLKSSLKNGPLSEHQINMLEDVFINAKLREPILKSILFTLEKKGLLILEKNNSRKCIDVRLVPNSITKEFLNSETFKIEYENINSFKKYYKRLNHIGIDNLIEKLFREKGVIIWDV